MPDFLTVVIQLPDDKDQRKKITSELRLGEEFHGGRVTGMSLDDEMTLNEQLIELSDPALVEQAQEQAAKIRQAAMT